MTMPAPQGETKFCVRPMRGSNTPGVRGGQRPNGGCFSSVKSGATGKDAEQPDSLCAALGHPALLVESVAEDIMTLIDYLACSHGLEPPSSWLAEMPRCSFCRSFCCVLRIHFPRGRRRSTTEELTPGRDPFGTPGGRCISQAQIVLHSATLMERCAFFANRQAQMAC